MKEKLFPERPYEKSRIDKFYWVDSDTDYYFIPLIKPYKLSMEVYKSNDWTLDTNSEGVYLEFDKSLITKMSSFEQIGKFNVLNHIIYGMAMSKKINSENNMSIPNLWFIYKPIDNSLNIFKQESDFKSELKKLNLPEEFLTPDEVYEQYKNDPVLPWFPENIKKQLEEAKTKQRK